MSYLEKDFFLTTETARVLFHDVAAAQPIIDFHTHLPVPDLVENRSYQNLTELWLKHDHYKWRALARWE
ncbi:MAG: glucuronate isomerase [Akkermansiaceae bacterium]|nr:glucuronate isomerase [Akkermansiaceae bacterium]